MQALSLSSHKPNYNFSSISIVPLAWIAKLYKFKNSHTDQCYRISNYLQLFLSKLTCYHFQTYPSLIYLRCYDPWPLLEDLHNTSTQLSTHPIFSQSFSLYNPNHIHPQAHKSTIQHHPRQQTTISQTTPQALQTTFIRPPAGKKIHSPPA